MIKTLVEKIRKIEKLPSWAQGLITIALCILSIASAFFSQMYTYFREITPKYLEEQFESTTTTSAVGALYAGNLNYVLLWAISVVFATIFAWAVFELVANIIYKNLRARRQVNPEPKFFRMVMRMGFIVCNLVYGLFSLLYFFSWSNVIISVGSSVFYILVYLATYTLVFLIFVESILYPGTVAAAYKRLLNFFCIMLGVIGGYNLLITFLSADAGMVPLICSAVYIAIIAAYYFVGRYVILPKLQKKQEGYVEIKIINSNDKPNQGGFDFDSYFGSAANHNRSNPFENENPFAGSEENGNQSSSPQNNSRSSSPQNKPKKDDDDEIFKGFGF